MSHCWAHVHQTRKCSEAPWLWHSKSFYIFILIINNCSLITYSKSPVGKNCKQYSDNYCKAIFGFLQGNTRIRQLWGNIRQLQYNNRQLQDNIWHLQYNNRQLQDNIWQFEGNIWTTSQDNIWIIVRQNIFRHFDYFKTKLDNCKTIFGILQYIV